MIFARYASGNGFFYIGEGITKELALKELQENYNTFDVESGQITADEISFWEATKIPARVVMKLQIEDY